MKLYTDGIKIRDEYGRQRIFRGENICIKDAEISPELLSQNLDACFGRLHPLGFNIVRLGVTWSLIEPAEHKYNNEIMDILHNFVKRCETAEIYVLLDMHQDLYSRKFHGDGMPDWVINKNIKPKKYMAIWAEGYFYMDSVQQAFCDFWNNADGVQDKFIKMWKYFASQFEDCSNIIGYDYLNEPYVERDGRKIFTTLLENLMKNAYCVNPDFQRHFKNNSDRAGFIRLIADISKIVLKNGGPHKLLKKIDNYAVFAQSIHGLEKYLSDFNRNYYQPFIERCDSEINKENLSFIEHNYFSNLGIEFDIETQENYIYSPHAYDLFVDSLLYNKYSSNNRMKFITNEIRKNQLKMNIPIIFGEWGSGAEGNEWIDHIEYVMDIMEENQWSNIYWNYRHENSDFGFRINRPYPVAICGDIIEYKTDSKNRTFSLSFVQKENLSGMDNIIYIPRKGLYRFKANTGKNKINIKY